MFFKLLQNLQEQYTIVRLYVIASKIYKIENNDQKAYWLAKLAHVIFDYNYILCIHLLEQAFRLSPKNIEVCEIIVNFFDKKNLVDEKKQVKNYLEKLRLSVNDNLVPSLGDRTTVISDVHINIENNLVTPIIVEVDNFVPKEILDFEKQEKLQNVEKFEDIKFERDDILLNVEENNNKIDKKSNEINMFNDDNIVKTNSKNRLEDINFLEANNEMNFSTNNLLNLQQKPNNVENNFLNFKINNDENNNNLLDIEYNDQFEGDGKTILANNFINLNKEIAVKNKVLNENLEIKMTIENFKNKDYLQNNYLFFQDFLVSANLEFRFAEYADEFADNQLGLVHFFHFLVWTNRIDKKQAIYASMTLKNMLNKLNDSLKAQIRLQEVIKNLNL